RILRRLKHSQGARMPTPSGRSIPLSLPRRFICDLLHFAKKVPSIPVQREMQLAPLLAARQEASPRPSWCAIFTKAYGVVAAARPELRRAYMSFIRTRLYEHPENVASVAVERAYADEQAVFIGQIRQPETRTLEDIDAKLKLFKESPIEAIGPFRRAMKIS